MRDPSERDHDLEARHRRDRRREIAAAGGDFLWAGLVLRRNAAHGVEDRAVDQLKAVIRPAIVHPRGEAELDEGRIKELACVVAGERTPGPGGPAQSRRQADDRNASVRFAKARNRRVPPVRVGGPVRRPERHEPRTIRAIVRRADVDSHVAVDPYSRNSSAGCWIGPKDWPRRWSTGRCGRSPGSRPILWIRWARSMNSSAWRRSSSATIGGWVEIVE